MFCNRLLSLFPAYYGGFISVCWSPDGKYVLTGGQDDLISIWCPSDGSIIARCQGHGSWVTAVAFDPWRCDERNYRFGSVGEDCKLCLWDFNVGMLHTPKAVSLFSLSLFSKHDANMLPQTSVRHRNSISSRVTGLHRAETQGTSTSRLRSNSGLTGDDDEEDGAINHTVEPRGRVPILPPVLTKKADKDPLCWLTFTEDAILTSSKTGRQPSSLATYHKDDSSC
jgi:catabolite repression protein CreC